MDTDKLPSISRPETLRETVQTHLRDAIMNGRFAPGERLIERELCDMLKVSRPPLREALRLLEAEKLIQLIPNRGPVVARIGVEEARELYALRGLLEGFAAHEFARLASDEQVALLGEKVKGLHVFLEHPDRKGLLAMKSQFYDVLLDGAGNRLINEVLTGLLSRVNLLRATSFSRPERLAQSLVEIDNLFEAIQRRDATQAQRLATLHIHNAQAVALAILEQN